MKNAGVSLVAFAVVVAGCVLMFRALPTAFVPQEDQGYIFVAYFLPDSASLDRTHVVGAQAADIIRKHPAVANVAQVDGYSLIDSQNKTNFGVLFVSLKNYEERKTPDALRRRGDRGVAPRVRSRSRAAWSCPVNPPAIPGLGITAGFQMWIEQKGSGDYQQLSRRGRPDHRQGEARSQDLAQASARTIHTNGQQMLADVDREKAEVLGVPVQDAYTTLQTMFGSLYVSQFPKDSRLYQVVLQAEPKYRMTPEDIGRFYVKNRDGDMVPLSALVNTQLRHRPRPRHALQQLPGHRDQRRAGTGRELRYGAGSRSARSPRA